MPRPHADRAADQELVTRTIQGDGRAFDELVGRYRGRVFALMHKLVNDHDAADSLTQETFIKAFEALGRSPPRTNVAAWLLRIAKRAALDRLRLKGIPTVPLRGSSSNSTLDLVESPGMQEPDGSETAHETPGADQLRGDLERALAQLRPEHRQAIMLSDVEGLSHEDAARIMGVPRSTVGTYVSRGREKLREIMGKPPAK